MTEREKIQKLALLLIDIHYNVGWSQPDLVDEVKAISRGDV